MTPPRPAAKSLVAERISAHRDPVSIARARGLDWHRSPALELYYEAGDPHSHLCAQLLPTLRKRVRAPIIIRLVGESAPVDYPEHERQRAYALADAGRIAPARGLHFPAGATLPDRSARDAAASALAPASDLDTFARSEPAIAAALFAGETVSAGPTGDVDALLAANAARRMRLGHNLPGVWQFDGDWFWGVDRMYHLEARLRERGLLDGLEPLAELHPEHAELPSFAGALPPLEFFFSFRSPYSYLAAVEMQSFHAEWPTGVQVRPVLPMAMRNLSVPRVKRMYTVRDVKREADRVGVPFGRIVDPLGAGAHRCLQTFPLAAGTEQQLQLLVSAARGIFSEGVDVATDEGLRYVVERAGVNWDAARDRIAKNADIDYSAHNREQLLDAGLWGVPCYRVGTFGAWGQDRFWMLREILRR
jgi:2-hydroxychromene-2-carboxylate isomerase